MTTITKSRKSIGQRLILILSLIVFLGIPQFASAHCDSYDGPVIKDALKALDQNKVELVLKWIEPRYEKMIIDKFDQTIKLRETNKDLETHFLETLVRVHREGEGAAYTGLKPAGSMTPMVAMADNSLDVKEVESVIKAVNVHLEELLREKFTTALKLSETKDDSVEQGRAYVEAYVQYTHTLEAIEHILHGSISH